MVDGVVLLLVVDPSKWRILSLISLRMLSRLANALRPPKSTLSQEAPLVKIDSAQ